MTVITHSSNKNPSESNHYYSDCRWILKEIKGSTEIAAHELKSPHGVTTFGRNADTVTIPTAHESCSRLHAQLTFTANTPYISDLNSTHGTFLNNERIPSGTPIELKVGDCLQFGASTRTYKLLFTEKESHKTNELIQPNVAIHSKLLDKIRAKEYKLHNIQTEMDRIEAKGDDSTWTDGQRAQLLRNREREAKLMEEIQLLQQQQAEVNDGTAAKRLREEKSTNAKNYEEDDNDIEGDTIFDRTLAKKIKKNNYTTPETEASLVQSWHTLVSDLKVKQAEQKLLQQKVHHLSQQISASQEEEDFFFIQNDWQLQTDNLEKITSQIQTMETELSQVERMIQLVTNTTNKYQPNRHTGELIQQTHQSSSSVSTPKPIQPQRDHNMPINSIISSLPTKMNTIDLQPMNSTNTKLVPSDMPPPPPRRVENSSIPSSGSVSKQKQPKGLGATLAFLVNEGNKESSSSSNLKSTAKPQNSIEAFPQLSYDNPNNNDDDVCCQWVAPKDQDGSGKTKLNAKFQGRY